MPVYVAVAEKNGANPRQVPPARPLAGGKASPQASPAQPPYLGRLILQPREGVSTGAREFPLDGSDVSIGRAPSCRVVLPGDQLASRQHAQLQYQNGQYTIKDLGSSNGTYVNGVEIHDATVLNEGDRIKIGEHELVYSRTASRNTDGFPIPVPPAWPPAVAGETSRHPSVSASRAAAPAPSSGDARAEPAPGVTDPFAHPPTDAPAPASASAPASAAPPSPSTPSSGSGPLAVVDSASGAAAHIEQLRAQLVEASAGLALRVEQAEREVAEMRAALAEMERRIASVLATLRPAAAEAQAAEGEGEGEGDVSGESAGTSTVSTVGPEVAHVALLDELTAVTRLAADNPRHLDYITALAARAADLTHALQTERTVITALEEIRARLAELAG